MKKPPTTPPVKAAAKAAARKTSGRPANPGPRAPGIPLAQQAADVQALVASIPYNANKAMEHGRLHATTPPAGITAKTPSAAPVP